MSLQYLYREAIEFCFILLMLIPATIGAITAAFIFGAKVGYKYMHEQITQFINNN